MLMQKQVGVRCCVGKRDRESQDEGLELSGLGLKKLCYEMGELRVGPSLEGELMDRVAGARGDQRALRSLGSGITWAIGLRVPGKE